MTTLINSYSTKLYRNKFRSYLKCVAQAARLTVNGRIPKLLRPIGLPRNPIASQWHLCHVSTLIQLESVWNRGKMHINMQQHKETDQK